MDDLRVKNICRAARHSSTNKQAKPPLETDDLELATGITKSWILMIFLGKNIKNVVILKILETTI